MTRRNDSLLEAAVAIGARLCRDALWSGERCNWLGPSMEVIDQRWATVHRALGPELYSGTSGIAVFLARLYLKTAEPIFRTASLGAIAHALSRLEDVQPSARLGLYSGYCGIAYALADVGRVLNRPDLESRALGVLANAAEGELPPGGGDVIGGAAGAIPTLLWFFRRYGTGSAIEQVVRLGDALVVSADRSAIGWSWDTLHVPGQKNLTGFAHGVAGIAWALLELAAARSERKYRLAALEAFRYERHWFNPGCENWPDFRQFDAASGFEGASRSPGDSYSLAWCHGAPGIGLSRLRCLRLADDTECRLEAEAAIRTTDRALNSEQVNYSLCHGAAGNAELLIQADCALGSSYLSTTLTDLADRAIASYDRTGTPWPCGVPGGGESPNLMLGLAGIGYFFLRLFDQQSTPSILLLDPSDKAA